MPINDKDAKLSELDSEVFKMQYMGEFLPWANSKKPMIVDSTGYRRCGKSAKAIAWAKVDPKHIIIVNSVRNRERLLKMENLPPEQVLTTQMAKDRGFLRELSQDVEFWIDDAEEVIKSHFNRRVAGISLTDHYPTGENDHE